MSGTLLNIAAILVGSLIGVVLGDRLPAKIQESIMGGLGLVTLSIGMQNTFRTGNILIPLISVLIGTIIGELLDLDAALKRFGGWLQAQVQRRAAPGEAAKSSLIAARARFINGFVTSSLVFCIGPLAIIGSVQNGINSADIRLLAIKATLDFFSSIAFAASLGIGVAFSTLPTLIIQGGFSLLGVVLASAFVASGGALTESNPYIRELTATGGLLLLGLSLLLLNVKQLRIANYLPALLIAPLLILLAGLLRVAIYPAL